MAERRAANTETFAFRASARPLLNLILNNFYSNTDIFLREIISNSSDALDRIKHEGRIDSSKLHAQPELFIRIVPDEANKTLSIIDSGIGMTKAELVYNLGIISKSGTMEFKEASNARAKMKMIGTFGVGFYSAYLVSDKVIVTTKHNEDEQYIWESRADGPFTVARDTAGEPLGRGTKITLFLNEKQLKYLKKRRLKNLVRKHSMFIRYPIYLWAGKTSEKEIRDDEDEESRKKEGNVEDLDEHNQKTSKEKKLEVSHAWIRINSPNPIWNRDPLQVTFEEYLSFYKRLTGDSEKFLVMKHCRVKGLLPFKALLFVPKRAPSDSYNDEKRNNIKFYIRRVFLTDNCEKLIPQWLGFVRGVVHSDDFPLLISREKFQQNDVVDFIRRKVVRICIDIFLDLTKHEEEYNIFYKTFSMNIKLGIQYDKTLTPMQIERLARVLRFHSTKSGEGMTCLKDYTRRMKKGQKKIYYISGESRKALENSPFLERLKLKGIEVLFMVDAIDDFLAQNLIKSINSQLVSAARVGLEIEANWEEQKSIEEKAAAFKGLCHLMKNILDNKVMQVVVSNRIIDSPCVLLHRYHDWTPNMLRIMEVQSSRDAVAHLLSEKIMEINPDNEIMEEIRRRAEANKRDATVRHLVTLLYEIALITSGFNLDDPNAFALRIHKILKFSFHIDPDETGWDGSEAQNLGDEDTMME